MKTRNKYITSTSPIKNLVQELRHLVLLAFLVLVLLHTSSCGPRPPVLVTQSPTVIDYIVNEDNYSEVSLYLENESDDGENTTEQISASRTYNAPRLDTSDRTRLIAEDFDPYRPIVKSHNLSDGDILEISIFGNNETLVDQVVIAPDGRLYYLFIDGIMAKGKTLEELQDIITLELQDYFVSPEVAILPKFLVGQSYVVLGKVRSPGVFQISGATSIRQAIGEAGGIALGGFAGTTINISNLLESFIIRDGKKLDVNFEKLLHTEGFSENIYLQPGDYIYIASSLQQDVFILGESVTQKPIPYKDGMTLTAVMAGVSGGSGGWSTEAHVTKVLIVRGSLDDPITYDINLLKILNGEARDVYLLPGDIVYVQKKPFSFGRELVRSAINSFVGAFGGGAGGHWTGVHWFNP
jgi:polysaccharide export outer membrane protein